MWKRYCEYLYKSIIKLLLISAKWECVIKLSLFLLILDLDPLVLVGVKASKVPQWFILRRQVFFPDFLKMCAWLMY